MILQDEIRELVLSYFTRIGSRIVNNDGIYQIMIPEEYIEYFQSSTLKIIFDKDNTNTMQTNGCDLVIPGSRILFKVLSQCIVKGPISVKSGSGIPGIIIRYHFFIVFSGIRNVSKIKHVDINSETMQPVNTPYMLCDTDFTLQDQSISDKINKSYMAAIDELKTQCSKLSSEFIDAANVIFQTDYDVFVDKYDSQIRDLDDGINQKEVTSNDHKKIKKFRFDTLDKIDELRRDKDRMINTMQEKHKIFLEYGLVACTIILP